MGCLIRCSGRGRKMEADPTVFGGVVESDMKPKGKSKPKAGRADGIWKKAAALPPRIWTVGGAFAFFVVIAWFMLVPARREVPPPSPSGAAESGEALNRQTSATAVSPDGGIPGRELSFIKAIRLQPSQPTRMDTLKAEVEVASTASKELVYTYLWKVNDRIIEEATGDTLSLSTFKKRDLVTVTVTPRDGETVGFVVESPMVVIHSVPPSLVLKAMRQGKKTGEPVELQLVGVAPDGDQVAFSLEAPHVPGMTIDKQSGKISWRIQPDQKGVVRFGAAVEDDNRTKATKIFDITVE
jgi:hypothetical protein